MNVGCAVVPEKSLLSPFEGLQAVRHDELREEARRAAIRLYNEADDQICLVPSKDKDGNALKREVHGLRPMIRSLRGRLPSIGSRTVRPSVRRLEFDTRVWLEKPPKSGDWTEIYSFTAMQSESGAPSITLDDLQGWQSLYPDLANVHQEHGKLDGEVIHVQANFKLEEMPTRSHLGIQVFIDIAHTEGYTRWRYSSRFYTLAGKPFNFEDSSDGQPVYILARELRPSPIIGSSKVRLEIPLESKWWVRELARFSHRRSAALAQGTLEFLQQEERRIRRELRGISISQEIFATDVFGCERRLTTLLWRFDQTTGEVAATTVWRKVIQHQFRHATPSPKIQEYENFSTNALLPMDTMTADDPGTEVLLQSIEGTQSRSGQELEWLGQSDNMAQARLQTGDEMFNIAHMHQGFHLEENQLADTTNGTTGALTSQSIENAVWEPTSCNYVIDYDKLPCDYHDPVAPNENHIDQAGTGHTAEEHGIYQSQNTNHELEDFTGGEICLRYDLDNGQPNLELQADQPSQGDPGLHDLGLESSHGLFHNIMEHQHHSDELVLDPAFNDPNHAINNPYHYSNLDQNNIQSEHPFPMGHPEYQSPAQQDQYEPPAVEHSRILASQPEATEPEPNDQNSEHSMSQPQSIGETPSLPSQQDHTPHSQGVESLHFEDNWDPNLVPHLFDGTDFHAAALEILGTEIILPDAPGCGVLGYHVHEDEQGHEHARVLGEIEVDIGVEEAKDWVLVKGLDGHA